MYYAFVKFVTVYILVPTSVHGNIVNYVLFFSLLQPGVVLEVMRAAERLTE
jgi:hypothetical protein